MNKKVIPILHIIIIIVILLTAKITAQNPENTHKPKNVKDTIINKHPVIYNKGKYGGTLTLGLIGKPKTFNEMQAQDSASLNIINHLFIPLFHYNIDRSEWEVVAGNHNKGKTGKAYDIIYNKKKLSNENNPNNNAGEMEIIVYLRNDVYWTDGTFMTADDWVWYYNNIICNEEINHPAYESTFLEINKWESKQIQYEKIDKYSFKIIFPKIIGEPELIGNSQVMPMHIFKSILENQGIGAVKLMWNTETPPKEIISNGPWKIKKYYNPYKIVLEKNHQFFIKENNTLDALNSSNNNTSSLSENNKLPYIDNLVYRIISNKYNPRTKKHLTAKYNEYKLFMNGEIDAIVVDNTILDGIANDNQTPNDSSIISKVISEQEKNNYLVWNGGTAPHFDFLSFNLNSDSKRFKFNSKYVWFSNRDFRKAISLFIDRESILEKAYDNYGEINKSIIPSLSPYYDPETIFEAGYNPKLALKLLKELNITDKDGDGILEDKNNNKIKFEILTNDLSERSISAEIVNHHLNSYGIKSSVNVEPFDYVVSKINRDEWDCILIGITGHIFPLTLSNFFLSNGNMHIWNPVQKNPTTTWETLIDNSFNKAYTETDFEKRKSLINEMLMVIYEELPIMPLIQKYSFLAINKKWKNVNWDIWTDMGDTNFIRLYDITYP